LVSDSRNDRSAADSRPDSDLDCAFRQSAVKKKQKIIKILLFKLVRS
jgi:hypothetical protein